MGLIFQEKATQDECVHTGAINNNKMKTKQEDDGKGLNLCKQ